MSPTFSHLMTALPLVLATALSTHRARADDCDQRADEHSTHHQDRSAECSPPVTNERSSADPTGLLGAPDPVEEAHFFGARGAETWTGNALDEGRTLSATAAVRHFDYDARRLFSGRSVGNAFIGGGSAGFEGGIAGALGAGLRAPFGRTHGVVARLGLEGYLLGNARFYASSLELPQGQLGYQILTRTVLFELTGTAGPVLTSRYRSGAARSDAPRGLVETGARLGAGFRHVHLELGYSRYERSSRSPDWELHRFAGSLCGMAGGVGVCADMEIFDRGSPRITRGDTAYLGLQLGVLTGQRTHAGSAPQPKAPATPRRTASTSAAR
jgi:hypothetical protein